ncbi:MAG: DMT family transporter [Hyphomicrobiaceae bacterium]
MTGKAAISTTMGAADWSLLILLSVLWGATYFFVAVAVDFYTPLVIVLARVGLAALALNVLLLAMRIPITRSVSVWGAFFVMGILNNLIPFTLMTWGQTHIAGGLTAILNASTPLFAVIVAHFFTEDEKLAVGRIAGLAIGFGGVVMLVGVSALQELGSEAIAQLAVVCGALSFALAGVFGRRFQRLGLNPIMTATGQLTASTVLFIPVTLLFGGPWVIAESSLGSIASLIGLAVLSTAIAYIVYFRLLASAGAVNMLLVTMLLPVTAILLGVTILDEVLAPRHIGGMGLIVLGLAAMDGRPARYIYAALGLRS